jgi:hypothetical protein
MKRKVFICSIQPQTWTDANKNEVFCRGWRKINPMKTKSPHPDFKRERTCSGQRGYTIICVMLLLFYIQYCPVAKSTNVHASV